MDDIKVTVGFIDVIWKNDLTNPIYRYPKISSIIV